MGGLKPGVHYLPIDPSITDLAEKATWARENDAAAKKIVENLIRFQSQILPESVDCYISGLLEAYAKLLTYTPRPIEDYPGARLVVPGPDMGIHSCTNPIFACGRYVAPCENKTKVALNPIILARSGKSIDRCRNYAELFR